jgi:hypothetical protein
LTVDEEGSEDIRTVSLFVLIDAETKVTFIVDLISELFSASGFKSTMRIATCAMMLKRNALCETFSFLRPHNFSPEHSC